MLLDRIEIFGYKRFVSANAYVGRKAVALVGPNEAGKSTVLAALRLVDDSDPVPASTFSRSLRPLEREQRADVVRLSYALTKSQLKLIDDMPLSVKPRLYVQHKQADGKLLFSFAPRPVVMDSVRSSLQASWPQLFRIIENTLPLEEEQWSDSQADLRADIRSIQADLDTGEAADDETWDRVTVALANKRDIYPSGAIKLALDHYFDYVEWARPGVNLQVVVQKRLKVKRPPFAMFSGAHRELLDQYSLEEASTDQSLALGNLLSVAGVTLEEIRGAQEDGPYLKHLLEQASSRLERFFAERWSQEPVGVGLHVDGSTLQIFVRDTGESSVGWLSIDERSDGLRLFVALATFLANERSDSAPILLIDEAEQHLHLNAQADLVQMLTGLSQITQVIYTTHSPGCLPGDIGNGVRFVEPDGMGNSRIRHDFWSLENDGHVGFNPLLLVMGAGAAAFSGLRNAVFVEGASDMLLLPSLLREAGVPAPLPYQVAPGIAVAGTGALRQMDFVAGRVTFIVDGDEQGINWNAALNLAGVPDSRIRSLPSGLALEDLLDRNYYLQAIAELLHVDFDLIRDVPAGQPVKLAVEKWAESIGRKMPGAVAVAEFLLGRHESGDSPIKLGTGKARTLKAMDSWIRKQLDVEGKG